MVKKVKEVDTERLEVLVKVRYIGGGPKIIGGVKVNPGDTLPKKMRREEVEGRKDFEEVRKETAKQGGDKL